MSKWQLNETEKLTFSTIKIGAVVANIIRDPKVLEEELPVLKGQKASFYAL